MMKNTLKVVVLSLVTTMMAATFSMDSSACSKDGKEGFLPRNDFYIPVRRVVLDQNGAPEGGGITEAEFNGVIDSVMKVYSPIVAAMGGTLKVARNWTDGTVNAYANREGKEWWINMFGGLARHKETTIDGFLLVVCHELGHQIGGAPKYSGRGNDDEWAGNEGQADYWATLKCARRVLAQESNLAEVAAMKVPPTVSRACSTNFSDPNQYAVCIRNAMGGLALSRLLATLRNPNLPEAEMPWFTHKDPTIVTTMFDAHPAAQCRLDTYAAGSICNKSFLENVDQQNALVGTCSIEQGAKVGARPRCWYLPGAKLPTPRKPRAPRTTPPAMSGYYF